MQRCCFEMILFVEQQLNKNSRTHPIILSTEMADELITILQSVRCIEGTVAEDDFYKINQGFSSLIRAGMLNYVIEKTEKGFTLTSDGEKPQFFEDIINLEAELVDRLREELKNG